MASPGCKVKKNNSFLIADICYVSFAFQHDTHPQKARRFDHFEFEKVSFFIVGYLSPLLTACYCLCLQWL